MADASIAGTGSLLLEPDLLFDCAVTHDGQRFLINETVETAANPSPITLLTNWIATIKK